MGLPQAALSTKTTAPTKITQKENLEMTEPDKTAAVKDLQKKAEAVDKAKASTTTAAAALDATVLDARKLGVKYREIAEACDRSVAWVQATLAKQGYVGERSQKPLAKKKSRSAKVPAKA